MDERVILSTNKVYGRGRVQISKRVRDILNVIDGDFIYFIQNEYGEILMEKAPTPKDNVGKYSLTRNR